MDIRALIFNSGTFERKALSKMDEQELYQLWWDDDKAQVHCYTLDEFSEAFNDEEVSDQDWLYFVDFDEIHFTTYAPGTLVYDDMSNQYTLVKDYDRAHKQYILSDGCHVSRELMRHRQMNKPKVKCEHTEKDLPDWVRQGKKVHFRGNVTGHPYIKGVQDGIVWIGREGCNGGKQYYGHSIDYFIQIAERKYIEAL